MIPANLVGPVINPVNLARIDMSNKIASMIPLFGVSKRFSKDVSTHSVGGALNNNHVTVFDLLM